MADPRRLLKIASHLQGDPFLLERVRGSAIGTTHYMNERGVLHAHVSEMGPRNMRDVSRCYSLRWETDRCIYIRAWQLG